MRRVKRVVEEKGLLARTLKMKGLIDYREGSVVSREVIRKKTGIVTLFAFDRGEGLSEHTAPFDALVYVLEGEARVSISGKPVRVREAEAVIMPAGKPHALKAVRRFKMLLVMVRS